MTNVAPTERTKPVKTSARTQSGRLATNSERCVSLDEQSQRALHGGKGHPCPHRARARTLDKCRAAYIAHLRSEYRKSPRAVSEEELRKAPRSALCD
jgi:hypothetical protein